MSTIAIIFWIWVAGSAVALIARRVQAHRAEANATDEWLADSDDNEAGETTENLHAYVGTGPLSLGSDDAGDAPPAPPPPASADAPPPSSDWAPAEQTPPPPPPALGTFPAPASPEDPTTAPHADWRSTERTTVASVLTGVRMPCDLAPVSSTNDSDESGRRMAFATTEATPGELGQALAAELARLGMTFETVNDHCALAHRGEHALQITLHRTGASFPLAADHAIVVEFEVV